MPTLRENPCVDSHQELALMSNVTSLLDVNAMMLCNRCGDTMTFEDAVRNDERMRIVRGIQKLNDHLSETGGVVAEVATFTARQALAIARGLRSERSDG